MPSKKRKRTTETSDEEKLSKSSSEEGSDVSSADEKENGKSFCFMGAKEKLELPNVLKNTKIGFGALPEGSANSSISCTFFKAGNIDGKGASIKDCVFTGVTIRKKAEEKEEPTQKKRKIKNDTRELPTNKVSFFSGNQLPLPLLPGALPKGALPDFLGQVKEELNKRKQSGVEVKVVSEKPGGSEKSAMERGHPSLFNGS